LRTPVDPENRMVIGVHYNERVRNEVTIFAGCQPNPEAFKTLIKRWATRATKINRVTKFHAASSTLTRTKIVRHRRLPLWCHFLANKCFTFTLKVYAFAWRTPGQQSLRVGFGARGCEFSPSSTERDLGAKARRRARDICHN
jgi:hypothetical protein